MKPWAEEHLGHEKMATAFEEHAKMCTLSVMLVLSHLSTTVVVPEILIMVHVLGFAENPQRIPGVLADQRSRARPRFCFWVFSLTGSFVRQLNTECALLESVFSLEQVELNLRHIQRNFDSFCAEFFETILICRTKRPDSHVTSRDKFSPWTSLVTCKIARFPKRRPAADYS